MSAEIFGVSSIFARDEVHRRKSLDDSVAQVAQVAYGRGDDIESALLMGGWRIGKDVVHNVRIKVALPPSGMNGSGDSGSVGL